MKNLLIVILNLITINIAAFGADGIIFFEGTWEEVKKEARKTGKPIFVDFYADWCGPCQWMSDEVFTDSRAGNYFNSEFINFQIDAEYDELELVELIELEAYPTLVFFDADGVVLSKHVGALDVDELLVKGRNIIQLPDIRQAYENDPSNHSALISYLEVIGVEEANVLATNYLNSLSRNEWKSEQSWTLIAKYLVDFRSEPVQYVIDNSQYFQGYDGYTTYMLEVVLRNVLEMAIDENDKELMQLAIDIEIKTRELGGILEYPKEYYSLETQYLYSLHTEDYDNYFLKLSELVETYLWDDSEAICGQAMDMLENIAYDTTFLEKAITWAKRAVELDNVWYTNYVIAYCYYLNSDHQEAIAYATEARKLTEDQEILSEIDSFILEVESEF